MRRCLTLALIAGVLPGLPGKAATLIVPDGYGDTVNLRRDLDPASFENGLQEPQNATLGTLFGVTNGEASLSRDTFAAIGTGMKAPGQFVVVYDPAADSLLSGTISGLFKKSGEVIARRNFPAMSPVPEPAVWVLLLLGTGGVGVALRRYRLNNFTIRYD